MAQPQNRTSIIEKIEIKYFRSVHNILLNKCKRINILTGGNDSGKSNILRALNLFFNNETDFETLYNFDRDLSHLRVKETQESKTKAFLYIKITFNNVFGYSSLPDQFSIKKQWNRYYEEPDVYTFPRDLNQASVTRFQNNIEFHYVPAIKGRDIFQHYLTLVHDSLIEQNIRLKEASLEFSRVIQEATEYMESRIKSGLDINSKIEVPENLSELFGELDFSTQVNNSDWISLKQRGDGIQVGHIPYILDFLAQQDRKKASIWAYEEPENSLEMNKAFELAGKFETDFSKRNQIFLTTHSPAFYSIDTSYCRKWFVDKTYTDIEDETFSVSETTDATNIANLNEKLGVAALIQNHAKEEFEKITQLNNKLKELELSNTPIVFFEGITDLRYIQKANDILGLISPEAVNFIQADSENPGGSDKMKQLKEQVRKNPTILEKKCLFLFDCDERQINTEINGNIATYRFQQKENAHITNGIENNFPIETIQEIYGNDTFFRTTTSFQSGGAKTITVRELKKTDVCNFLCERGQLEDFEVFRDFLTFLRDFIE